MGNQFLQKLYDAQDGICAYCGTKIPALHLVDRHDPRAASVDHVDPTARGGSNDAYNKVAMHRVCNCEKGSNMPRGCTLIWRDVVNAKLDIVTRAILAEINIRPKRGTLADVWPVP